LHHSSDVKREGGEPMAGKKKAIKKAVKKAVKKVKKAAKKKK
jgi:hypothetical protein